MAWDFKNVQLIKKRNFILTMCGCNRQTRYKSMLAKAEGDIAKELDLVKFLQRQRLTSFTALATLNSRQQYVADKMSTMLIRESSDLDEDTDEDFELEMENQADVENHARTIFVSKSTIDRRIIDSYTVKRWKDDFKRHKGKIAPFDTIQEERERYLKGKSP